MPLDASICLHVLIWALGLLLITGVASAWAGRWSERISVRLGAWGAGGACLAGLAGAVGALASGAEGTLRLPWSMPYGAFSIGLDPLSSFFLIPMFLLAGVAAVYAVGYFRPWKGRNPGRFWLFYNVLAASMAVVMTARNGVLFLVAWEVMSLASFFLVVMDDGEEGTKEAGWVYLVATHIGTAFLLALFILLGRAGGSQEFAAYAVPARASGVLFVLALIGFGTKAGLFPMHVWLPEAHPAAPSPVSAVMSGVMIKTGIYGIVRMWMVLGDVPAWCGWLVLGIGAVSGVLGIFLALAQRDLKRMLAYSSVENIGIIALGLGLGMVGQRSGAPALAVLGFGGAFLHVLNHALFKGLLFLGAGAVVHAAGTRNLERMGGLLRRMPWTGAAFAAGAVAICGLPPFNGFAGEFLLYRGAFQSVLREDFLAVGGGAVLGTLALIGGLAVAAFTRALGIAFLGEPRAPEAAGAHEADGWMRGPMVVLAGLCLAVGLAADGVMRLLAPAVAMAAGVEGMGAGMPAGLTPVAGAGLFVLVLVAGLVLVRRRLLAKRSVRAGVTWDCGYAAPAASMQYTATGYAQPLTHGGKAILRPERECRLPEGLYPQAASWRSETPDVVRANLFDPLFRRAAGGLGRLRWLQQGRVHVYILYIVIVLMVLLGWAVQS